MAALTLKRVLHYISHLGLGGGLQAARLHCRTSLVRVRLPGLAHPLWARPNTSDVATFEEVFVAREYDLPFADFRPQHVLDLGANIGFASVYFAARWPQARILALEPSRKNLALLTLNTRPWRRITALQGAVWTHPTRLQIANPGAAPNAYRMTETAESLSDAVAAYTVDQLIAHHGCEQIDLVKMDVEGAEAEILRHGARWLDRIRVLMIELHDRLVPGCAAALCRALEGRRFHQEIVGANLALDFR